MSLNNKSLCLACSSSLPSSKSEFSNIFTTNCCHRPICPSCIASNSRLARYDPCLACLAGGSLLASTSAFASAPGSMHNALSSPPIVNLNGEVRDQDTFILGDDDEDEVEVAVSASIQISDGTAQENLTDEKDVFEHQMRASLGSPQEEASPFKYHLNRSDTLHGLSLRFGVDAHEICKLNNLPPNIIRHPNLLHTRTFLVLPPTTKPQPPPVSSKSEDKSREGQLVRERAVKRLQTLTKEVDWRIARAYVALADDEHEQEARAFKAKEVCGLLDTTHSTSSKSTGAIPGTKLESLAIERYLDDLEWEATEIKAGRRPSLPKFPFGNFESSEDKGRGARNNHHWWPWST